VVNDGGRFTFGAAGNPDFPQSTDVTVNAGGRFDLQQGENWGGLILDGGLVTFSGTRTGVNMNLDRITLRSGTFATDFGAGGTGGQITRLAAGQFVQKTTSGTVTFGPGTSIQPDAAVNLEDGMLDFHATALPASGNGAFTIGDVGAPVALRMSGVGTGTFGRYAYVGNPSLTIDVADAGGTMAVTGTVEGSGAVIKTGAGTLDLRRATALTNFTTVAAGTLRVSDPDALALSETLVQAGATLDVAAGATMRSPKVTVDGGTLQAGTLAVDAATGVSRLEFRGAGSLAGSPTVTVGTGGTLVLSSSVSQVAPLASLVVDEAAGGLVDLGGGGFVVAAGGIPEAALLADIAAGRGDGSWNGTSGITSSVASASALTRTVGWFADPNDGSVRVAFAAAGDANVDGQFDILDVAVLFTANKYDSGSPAIWADGDFNYDGLFDINDASDLLGTGLYDAGSYLPTGASMAPAVAAVPEPAALSVLGAVAAAVAAFRIRQPRGGCRGPRGGAR
jgi:autotransporter-associated beta strand protein